MSRYRGRRSVRRSSMVPLTRLAPVGLGFALGLYIVFSSAYLHASLWPVWAPLVVASTTAAGGVFTYGLDRWHELSRYGQVRVRAVVPRMAAIAAFLVVLGSTRFSGPAQSDWRGVELAAILFVGGATAVGVMEGLRLAVADDSVPHAGGEQTIVLIRLRQLLQRLLAAVGSLVTLSTLGQAPIWRWSGACQWVLGRPHPPTCRRSSCWSSVGSARCWLGCSMCRPPRPCSVADNACATSCSRSAKPPR